MVPTRDVPVENDGSSPHASGDGPSQAMTPGGRELFSPRERGWFQSVMVRECVELFERIVVSRGDRTGADRALSCVTCSVEVDTGRN